MLNRRHLTAGLAVATMVLLAACGSSSSSSSSSSSASASSGSASKSPITIGTSLSLSGDFSADGQAFERGYQLWAADQNAGRRPAGAPDQARDPLRRLEPRPGRHQLQQADRLRQGRARVRAVLDAADRARRAGRGRYGYAFVEGAGGAPSVFGDGLHNVFDVVVPVERQPRHVRAVARVAAAARAARRPPPTRPSTTRSPSRSSRSAQKILQNGGRQDRLQQGVPGRGHRLHADRRPRSPRPSAQAVLLGSVDVPTVSAFVHTFIQQHYNPKAFIATAGPDQGAAFVKAVGTGNENGIFVPERLVRRLPEGRQPEDGQGVHRQVRRHAVRGQRRRRRGVLGRPGRRAGGQGDRTASTTRRSSPTCTAA